VRLTKDLKRQASESAFWVQGSLYTLLLLQSRVPPLLSKTSNLIPEPRTLASQLFRPPSSTLSLDAGLPPSHMDTLEEIKLLIRRQEDGGGQKAHERA